MIISKELNDEVLEVLDNLVSDLSEAHCTEKDAEHYGDDTCTYCAHMAHAGHLIERLESMRPEDLS